MARQEDTVLLVERKSPDNQRVTSESESIMQARISQIWTCFKVCLYMGPVLENPDSAGTRVRLVGL